MSNAKAQPSLFGGASSAPQITWEVRNRFRLFREERDFQLHVDALRGRTILGAEDWLAPQGDGRGWARNMFARLCVDRTGKISQPCNRDNVAENYLTPADHPITARLTGTVPPGATCNWTFDDGEGPAQSSFPCTEPVNIRVRYGRTTEASVDISLGGEAPQRVATQIAVRDILIAGLGDSIASGEGNPDRAVALTTEGFCFRSYLTGGEYYRPGRAGYNGDRTCSTAGSGLTAWQKVAAQWSNPACHRSLYSYQARAAMALAAKFDHVAVTFLPLACSGATIDVGLLGAQRARECVVGSNAVNCQGSVNAQVNELRDALTDARKRQPQRQLDMIFLTVGANDIAFSGLVADVIVESAKERALFRRSGVLSTVEESRAILTRELPRRFAALRNALQPLVGGDLSRIVYTTYANPARQGNQACASGRDGFDIHPAFNADPARMANVEGYVEGEFLPQLRRIVLSGADPNNQITFVDQHQRVFADHSVCARGPIDPEFDRDCFAADGSSFHPDPVAGATSPMSCGRSASEFRPYSARQRWIRTANDSYFAAMTYPQGLPSASQPADIHDAAWGVLSAVYGGAVHPTAEGHAAMADAAFPAAVSVLGLSGANPDGVERTLLSPLGGQGN